MTIQVGAQTLNRTEIQKTVATNQIEATASSRMFFVDNLRVFLTILVVVFHLAITYGAEGSWYYRERPTTELAGILLTFFVILNQFYFMGLFFLISGYFVPGSVDRKGGLRFLKDRLVRLGIPLVVFALLLSPYIEYIKGITEGYFSRGLGDFYLAYWRGMDFAPGPLWFVEVLLAFTIIYLLGRAVWGRVKDYITQSKNGATSQPLTHSRIIAFILILAPLNFAVRMLIPIGEEWNHLGLGFFPQYILMFLAGILAYRNGWLPDLPDSVRTVWSRIAILTLVAIPLFMIAGGAADEVTPFLGGLTWQSGVLGMLEAIFCVSMAILLLSLFRKWTDRQGRFGELLSRNAYSVYIIHPLVIIPLAYLLRRVSIDPLLKFALIAPLGVSLCFVVAHLLMRRIPYSDRVL
jgi:surface polysaccharide O-acyltransferase-like enzyme